MLRRTEIYNSTNKPYADTPFYCWYITNPPKKEKRKMRARTIFVSVLMLVAVILSSCAPKAAAPDACTKDSFGCAKSDRSHVVL